MDELLDVLEDTNRDPLEVYELLSGAFKYHKRSIQILEDYAIRNHICPKCIVEMELHTWPEDRGECHGYPTQEWVGEWRCPECDEVY
jgi:rubrerythrin